ncbi:hypothetical protein M514_05682 [Trichuris suis]|uniref:Fucosyltransferase n=1 Tax=Trichuris suis TaxID=68888 RepID=A0A085MXN9_9BILA|nr:hypothetical protein M514_05682 [Trichuris suis]
MDPLLFPAEECEQLLFWYLCQCGNHIISIYPAPSGSSCSDAEAEVRSLLSESGRKHSKPTEITCSLLLPLLLEAGRQWQNNLLNAMIDTDVTLPYEERSVHLIAPYSDEETADASSNLNEHTVTSPEAEPLYLLSCDEHMVCQVRWHPQGRSVAASCMDEGVRLWHLRERQFTEWPLSPDSIVPESLCHVFRRRDALRPPYVSLCWNSEGTKFAVGMPNGFVTIRYENGKMFSSCSLHEGVIFDMCFSPNDGYLLSVGTDRACYVLDVATGEPIQRCVGHQDAVTCCIWHNNETFVTCGADGHILIWHVDVSEAVETLEGHSGCVNSIALSSDGDTLASASDDGVIKLWSLTGRKSIGDLYCHEGPALQVVFSPVASSSSNIFLASCSADCTVCLYDVTERRCLKRFTAHHSQVTTIDFSPDGELLGSGDFSGILHIWNVKTMAAQMTYDANSMDGGTITCIQWNNDSSRLAVGTERGKVRHSSFHVFLAEIHLTLFQVAILSRISSKVDMQIAVIKKLFPFPTMTKNAAIVAFSLFVTTTILIHISLLNERILRISNLIAKRSAKTVCPAESYYGKKPVLILMWVDYRDDHVTNEYLSSCRQLNCHVTFDRRLINESAAVIFYDNNIDTMDLSLKLRHPRQHFVLFLMEPPQASKVAFKSFERHFYTLTMSYRRDSDIFSPYGYFRLRQKPLNTADAVWKGIALSKSKIIVSIGNSCNTSSKREVYVEKLKQYIKVDVYGKCGNLKCHKTKTAYGKEDPCEQMVKNKYKFYLAFEKSVCKDFVTEKVFNRFDSHLVPVVLKRSIAQPLLPRGSFIAADDFNDPKELADYLIYLNKNWEAYVQYYKWKDYYEVMPFPKGIHAGMCKLCAKLRRDSCSDTIQPSKSAADIRQWFIDRSECVKDFGSILTRQKVCCHATKDKPEDKQVATVC